MVQIDGGVTYIAKKVRPDTAATPTVQHHRATTQQTEFKRFESYLRASAPQIG